jgi:hypothetical protein
MTTATRLHIDFEWWDKSDLDLRTYLFTRLGLGDGLTSDFERQVDLIDPNTAEVTRIDGFQYMVQTFFNDLPSDFLQRRTLVDAVFCVLLANGNRPMTVQEIADRVERPADTIIRTLRGPSVYQGIRPVPEGG